MLEPRAANDPVTPEAAARQAFIEVARERGIEVDVPELVPESAAKSEWLQSPDSSSIAVRAHRSGGFLRDVAVIAFAIGLGAMQIHVSVDGLIR